MLEQACDRLLGKRKILAGNASRRGVKVLRHCLGRRWLEDNPAVLSGHGRPTWSEERRVHAYGAQPASSVRWPRYLVVGAAFTEIASAST